jgi:hypothetical protein
MKKLFSVLVILCWLALPAQSQGFRQKPGPGVLEAMKTGFITRRLELSPEEAQKFWPIYNGYAAEVRRAYTNYRSQRNGNEIELEETLLNIRKKYSIEFLKAIPPPKINEFFRAEKDFNTFVQREMQRRQMQQRPYPAGPPSGPPQEPPPGQ